MATRANRWALGTLTWVAVLGGTSVASAQFNPYVMPRFNPGNPAAPAVTATTLPTSISPSYLGPYDPYYPSPYNPYMDVGPYGGALMGLADLTRASGTLSINLEQARVVRQQATQAKLDTQRKRFELDMYLKANTPTYTDDQIRVARTTLKRIHNNSTPAEIATGRALNLMLDDARKFPNQKVPLGQIALSEDVLQQLNVTAGQSGLGVLRNEGKIVWPLAVQGVVTPEQQKSLDAQAQALFQGAVKGKIDANVFRDFSTELDRIYDDLLKRANEIAGSQYLDAKRFLNSLRDARAALENGEAKHQVQFQRFVAGGKSIQEVADFMIGHGLNFASASPQDEAAYRAFYSALVAYDVALNSHGAAPPEPKENK